MKLRIFKLKVVIIALTIASISFFVLYKNAVLRLDKQVAESADASIAYAKVVSENKEYEEEINMLSEEIDLMKTTYKEEKEEEEEDTEKAEVIKYSYTSYKVPTGHNLFRSWMPASALSKTSTQYSYIKTASYDKNGLYKIDGCYCVALGSYYGKLGDVFRVTTSTGHQFKVIKCDVKDDRHTDSKNMYTTANGCMMEFIVNSTKLNKTIKKVGNVVTDEISGKIVKIELEKSLI